MFVYAFDEVTAAGRLASFLPLPEKE